MPTPEPQAIPDTEARQALEALSPANWRSDLAVAGVSVESVTGTTREAVTAVLNRLGRNLVAIQRPVRSALQNLLDELAGQSFGALEDNQAVTREVQAILSRLGLRVVCPKPGCGEPAYLRCAAAGNSKKGVFQFDHATTPRRTHLGSAVFPRMMLTDAPPDRRRAGGTS
jgi:hypothetical protein